MTSVYQLEEYFNTLLSEAQFEAWDNNGIIIAPDGGNAEVSGVVCALDCTENAIRAAVRAGANVIITHHPLIFDPLKTLSDDDAVGKRVISCIKNNITLLSYHTRLDGAEGGVSDCLASLFGLLDVDNLGAYGRIGRLERQMSYDDFSLMCCERLDIEHTEGVCSQPFCSIIALCGGSGKFLLSDAHKAGADTLLTGEVTHSTFLDAKALDMNLVCASHYATERVVLYKLCEMVKEGFPALNVTLFDFERELEYGI